MRSRAIKERIEAEIREKIQGTVDMSSTVKYARTPEEKAEYDKEVQEAMDAEDESEKEEEESKTEVTETKKEYIFLIDRSYSMTYTIKLAREALVLFLHSLPADSYFNVCSYGSRYEFMFKGSRSVPYNDENLQHAVDEVS